jgi:hypothetical protein
MAWPAFTQKTSMPVRPASSSQRSWSKSGEGRSIGSGSVSAQLALADSIQVMDGKRADEGVHRLGEAPPGTVCQIELPGGETVTVTGQSGAGRLQHSRREVQGQHPRPRETVEERLGEQPLAAAELHEETVARVREHIQEGLDLLLAVRHEEAAVVDEVAAVGFVPTGLLFHAL